MQLKFSMPHQLRLPAMTQPWEAAATGADLLAFAKWAEKLGYGMLSVPEHYAIPQAHLDLSGPHYFSAYAAMAVFAGATERIRVNSCIALLPALHPIASAKLLATMDWLCSGRVTVTFAVGWLKGEFDALGIPFSERGARAEEYIQAIIALWTQEKPEFEGKFVSFRDIAFEPKCVQRPHLPVWFGGDADPVLRRIARYGSGWSPFLTRPEDIPARIDFITAQPDYRGQPIDIYYGIGTTRVGDGHVAQDDPTARAGQGRQELIDRLGWFKTLGVTWSAVPIPPMSAIAEYYEYTQWIAEEIMPAVR